MTIELVIPTIVVDRDAIRNWITSPDAGPRAERAAGWAPDDEAQDWWGDQHVGDDSPEPYVTQDESWLGDLLLYAKNSPGLFGDAEIRAWLMHEDFEGVKNWSAVLGVRARTSAGKSVTLAEEVAVWNLIFPSIEGTKTDVTVAVLERIGNALQAIADGAS